MSNACIPRRSEAVLRLVRADTDDASVIVDGVVAASDGSGWPAAGTPVSLRLELPRARWMADALAQLLAEWAEEDAVVTTTLVTTAKHTVARVGRSQSHISLELLAADGRSA